VGYDTSTRLILGVIMVIALMLSASFHEFSHALAAHLCGDDTAKEDGRLTPNPLKHMDPFGSVLLPLLLYFSNGPMIAYAKPVPYNPYRLKNRKVDEAIVAVAGPLSNLLLAVVCALVLRLGDAMLVGSDITTRFYFEVILSTLVYLNLSLCFFNILPIPPLDGSKIITLFLPLEARDRYYAIERYALPILIVLLWVLPSFAGIDLIGMYFNVTVEPLYEFLCW
jgi:Zn-dependent protease